MQQSREATGRVAEQAGHGKRVGSTFFNPIMRPVAVTDRGAAEPHRGRELHGLGEVWIRAMALSKIVLSW